MVFGILTFTFGRVSAERQSSDVQGVATTKTEMIEKPVPSSDFQSSTVISSSIKLCSNAEFGFEMSYPADWFTTFNTESQKCSFFAPYSFVLPQLVSEIVAPVTIEIIEPDNWLTTLKFYENPNDFYSITSSSNIELNGRLVKKIEARSTTKNSVPAGSAYVNYLIFDGLKPLRITYTQLDKEADTKSFEKVVEGMIESINYF